MRRWGLVAWALLLLAPGCSGGGGAGGDGDGDGGADGGADSGQDGDAGVEGVIGGATYLGPWGGAVKRIAEDPTAPGRLVAIVGDELSTAALFASADGGATWSDLGVPTDWSVASALFLDDGRLVVGTDFEILVSSDFGATLDDIRGNIEEGSTTGITVRGLAYEPGDPGRLWAALGGAYAQAPIWSLVDGETEWAPWNAPAGWADDPLNGAAYFTELSVRYDEAAGAARIFAAYEESFAAGGGVFCSLDSGATFARCDAGLPNVPFYRVIDREDAVVAAGGHVFGDAFAGVWYSTDDGASWVESTDEIPSAIANDVARLADGSWLAATYGAGLWRASALDAPWEAIGGFGAMTINAVAQLAGGELLAGPEQLGAYRSADGGATWQASAEGMDRLAPAAAGVDPADRGSAVIAVNSLNSGLALHTAGGVDGWAPIPGLPGPRFTLVDIAPSGRWYAVSDGPTTVANDGLYVSADGGATFSFIGPLTGANMDHEGLRVAEVGGPAHLVVAGNYFVTESETDPWVFVAESLDAGATWAFPWEGAGTNGSYSMADFAALADGSVLLAVAGQPLVRLRAAGEATSIAIPAAPDALIFDLATCAADPERWIALGYDGVTYAPLAFATRDGGATWSVLSRAGFESEAPLAAELHPLDCDLVFLATDAGIVRASHDGGGAWEEVDVGEEIVPASMRVVPLADGRDAALLVWGQGGLVRVNLTTAVE